MYADLLQEALWAAPKNQKGGSSAGTDLAQVPALLRGLKLKKGSTNADIGGGRSDKGTNALAKKGVKNHVFDPYNRDEKHNAKAAAAVKGGKADTATVANVLNVIQDSKARARVIRQAKDAVGPSGVAYFSVYEGDGSGKGKKTPKGWQENRRLASYVPEIKRHFSHVEVKGGKIIARQKAPQTEASRSAIDKLVSDAKAAGMEVRDAGRGSVDIIAQRHGGSGRVLRGIRVYDNGTAIDMTVDLSVAKGVRDAKVMRKILRLTEDRDLLAEGSIRQEDGKWCVVNDPTGNVITAKGKRRCYDTREEAEQVWYRLDAKYTGRHRDKIKPHAGADRAVEDLRAFLGHRRLEEAKRAANALRESLTESRIRKGMHDLPGGGSVKVEPMPKWRREMHGGREWYIQVWPEDLRYDDPPGPGETDALLDAAGKKLGVRLKWAGEWKADKYAGYYREAEALEKLVRKRSRAIGQWLDKAILSAMDAIYKRYESGLLRREPSVTATYLRDSSDLGHGPEEWYALDAKAKTSRINASLQRLKKKGKLATSTGISGGRDARLYEPMWFAKKHGHA